MSSPTSELERLRAENARLRDALRELLEVDAYRQRRIQELLRALGAPGSPS